MSKYVNGMLGLAIGDAFGVPLEGTPRKRLVSEPVTDYQFDFVHQKKAGDWSSGTSLTIATIESFNEVNGFDYQDMMNKYLSWLMNGDYTSTKKAFNVGVTTNRALNNYFLGKMKPVDCGLNNADSNDNGSLLRMLPIAIYCYEKRLNFQEISELVNNITSLTHRHEISKLGNYIYVNYCILLLDGYDKYRAYELLKKIDYSMYKRDAINRFRKVIKNKIYNFDLKDIYSNTDVVKTLESVFWIILNTETFKQAIIGACNLGDATSSIGAITGSLAGLIYQFDDIPNNWIINLTNSKYLIQLMNNFEINIGI